LNTELKIAESGWLLRVCSFSVMFTEIDFEEFLAIYKRILVLSKTAARDHVNDNTRQPPKLAPVQQIKAGSHA